MGSSFVLDQQPVLVLFETDYRLIMFGKLDTDVSLTLIMMGYWSALGLTGLAVSRLLKMADEGRQDRF